MVNKDRDKIKQIEYERDPQQDSLVYTAYLNNPEKLQASGGIAPEVVDYNLLTNKPMINGATVGGNRTGDFYGLVNTADVVDSLTSQDPSKPLSANQGYILNQQLKYMRWCRCTTTITGNVGDDISIPRTSILDFPGNLPLEHQLFISDNNGTVGIYNGSSDSTNIGFRIVTKRTDVFNALTSNDTTIALSANMGRVLAQSLQVIADEASLLAQALSQQYIHTTTMLNNTLFGETEIPYSTLSSDFNPSAIFYRFSSFIDSDGRVAIFNGGTGTDTLFTETVRVI